MVVTWVPVCWVKERAKGIRVRGQTKAGWGETDSERRLKSSEAKGKYIGPETAPEWT